MNCLIHFYKLTSLIYVKVFVHSVLPKRRLGVVDTSKTFCPAGHCSGKISLSQGIVGVCYTL